jgi:serine-type D-Ala-D-Ala carboxypeptidase/endopeptidase (penicillin-binding protein 4)
LSIGGADGTLRSRFRHTKDRRIVRAKTGTLDAVASLSGYVLAPPGKSPIAFSILVNKISGKVGEGRKVIDQCVSAIVKYLWDGAPLGREQLHGQINKKKRSLVGGSVW